MLLLSVWCPPTARELVNQGLGHLKNLTNLQYLDLRGNGGRGEEQSHATISH